MEYDEIVKHCEALVYRDKFRLSQLLIQLARKEEEIQNPQKRNYISEKKDADAITQEPTTDVNSIQYVTERLDKLRPSQKKTLINSIRAMYQFQGAISEEDQKRIIDKLKKKKFLKIESNNRVTYL